MNVKGSLLDLIGKTPLMRAERFEKSVGISDSEILVKLECMNPAGSAKDRAALYMIEDAEKKGLIKKGATVIEPTSGNTGIGLAAICAVKGYKAVIVLPDSMSIERRAFLSAYGATLVLTEGSKGMKGCIEKAEEIHKNTENSFILGQFDNPSNPLSHYMTTGPEIYEDTDGALDLFIASIGTGGTVSGVGKYLKEKNSSIKVIGVEPTESPLITKGYSSPHKIEGIGANFIPKNLDRSLVDEMVTVSAKEAMECGRTFASSEGILVGVSSGAALAAAKKLCDSGLYKGKRIVILLPDSGDRYLSGDMYKQNKEV